MDIDPAFKRRITSIHPEALYKSVRATTMLRETTKFTPKLHDWLNGTKVAELMRDWQGYHRYGTFHLRLDLTRLCYAAVVRLSMEAVLKSSPAL